MAFDMALDVFQNAASLPFQCASLLFQVRITIFYTPRAAQSRNGNSKEFLFLFKAIMMVKYELQ